VIFIGTIPGTLTSAPNSPNSLQSFNSTLPDLAHLSERLQARRVLQTDMRTHPTEPSHAEPPCTADEEIAELNIPSSDTPNIAHPIPHSHTNSHTDTQDGSLALSE